MNDYISLAIYIALGIPLFYEYSLIPKESQRYWGENTPFFFKVISSIGVLLAFIAGTYSVYFAVVEAPKENVLNYEYEPRGKIEIYIAIILLAGFQLLWVPGVRQGGKLGKAMTTIGLLGTSAGSILLFTIALINHPDNVISHVFFCILAVQCTIMDLLLWSLFFYKKIPVKWLK
jgi:hypothetical protein